MIKLVLSDMDRTLLPHGSYVVPKRTMEEIHEAAKGLAALIAAPTLDRKAISNTAGRISSLAYREVGRRY